MIVDPSRNNLTLHGVSVNPDEIRHSEYIGCSLLLLLLISELNSFYSTSVFQNTTLWMKHFSIFSVVFCYSNVFTYTLLGFRFTPRHQGATRGVFSIAEFHLGV